MVDPEAVLATANFWIELSTAAVVAGVIIEFFDLLLFNKEMGKTQRRLLFVGAFFVVLGCGGEFWFEHVASDAEAALQRQSDERVAALVTAEAVDNKIATQAAAAAAGLGVKVQTLPAFVKRTERAINGQVATFRNFAASARSQEGAIEAQLITGRRDLTEARAAAQTAATQTKEELTQTTRLLDQEKDLRDRIAALTTPRVLSTEQIAALVALVKQYPKTPFDLYVNQDLDSTALVAQLGFALEQAGWAWKGAAQVSDMQWNIEGKPPVGLVTFSGLRVELAESARPTLTKPGDDLIAALRADGLTVTPVVVPDAHVRPKFDKTLLHVIVGAR